MFIVEIMKRQLLMLDDLIDETEKRLKTYDDLPDMTLVSRVRSAGCIDYYEQDWNNGNKKLYPLGKADNKKVIAYKRQRYFREKLKLLKLDRKAIEQFLAKYKDYSPETIQKKLPVSYQELPVGRYEDTGANAFHKSYRHLPYNIYKDERFKKLLSWASEKYNKNPMPLPHNPNIARDGTPMRSKGECMWYDNILFEGLPVRYDPELIIQGRSGQWHKLYPDFQFKCFDGSIILVEHFGDWADERYAERNKRKIQEYLDCGFILGDNLIGTSDDIDHHTNELMMIEALDKIKERMFA